MCLVKEDFTEVRFDIFNMDFKNCFQHPRIQLGYMGNVGIIPKNEAAKILFNDNPSLITKYIFMNLCPKKSDYAPSN